jgi:trimeric autotransporter adhesin
MNQRFSRLVAAVAPLSLFVLATFVTPVAGCGSSSSGSGGGASDAGAVLSDAATTLTQLQATGAEVGKQGKVRITFTNPVAEDTDVTLATSAPAIVNVPAHVSVPRGALSAEVLYDAAQVGTAQLVAMSGTAIARASAQVVDAFKLGSQQLGDARLEKGATSSIGVSLNAVTPTSIDVPIALADGSIASTDAKITIPPFSSFGTATLNALVVGSTTYTATFGGTVAAGSVTVVDHAKIVSSYLNPQVAEVGALLNGYLSLDAIVAATRTVAIASSDPKVVTPPATLLIPAGTSSAQLTGAITGAGPTKLSFTLADSSTTLQVTGVAKAHLSQLSMPAIPSGGGQALGNVQFDVTTGALHDVALSSSAPSIVTVPDHVTVPSGNQSASFPVVGLKDGDAVITATFGGFSVQASVHVGSDTTTIQAYLQSPRLVVGVSANLQVYEQGGSYGSQTVALTSGDPSIVTVRDSLFIANYGSSVPVFAQMVGATSITASIPGSKVVVPVEVVGAATLRMNPEVRVAPGGSQPTSFDVDALPLPGTIVTFTSSNPAVAVAPAPMSLGNNGATSGSFTVTGLTAGSTVITGTLGTSTSSTVVLVGSTTPPPAYLASVSVSSGTLAAGATAYGYVNLGGTAQGSVPVTLSVSPAGVVSLPQATAVVPAGNSQAYFPVVAAGAGTATITATLGTITKTAVVVVVAKPTFTLGLGGAVSLGTNLLGNLGSDSALPGDVVFTVTSSNPAVATVAPASVTLSPVTQSSEIVVTPVTAGTTTITVTGGGATFTQAVVVSP